MPAPSPASLDLPAIPGSPIELSKAHLKELRALGHKVERFLAVRAACRKYVLKEHLEALAPWLGPNGPEPDSLGGEGLFACPAVLAPDGFKLSAVVLDQTRAADFAANWQRHDPEAPRALPPPLVVPADANAPLWLALLRLRPLRPVWERELRRGTLENLLDRFPDAWVLDPRPLPPGAVIPRLELSSWHDLPRLHNSGRRFLITSLHSLEGGVPLGSTQTPQLWHTAIQQALDSAATEPRILLELPQVSGSAETAFIAFFEKKADRVDGLGILSLSSPGAFATIAA